MDEETDHPREVIEAVLAHFVVPELCGEVTRLRAGFIRNWAAKLQKPLASWIARLGAVAAWAALC